MEEEVKSEDREEEKKEVRGRWNRGEKFLQT